MSDAHNISEAEVIATLTAQGRSLDDYVLLGGDMPGIDYETEGQSALVIEDDALAEASVQFLKKRGARFVAVRDEPAVVRAVDNSPMQRTGEDGNL